MAESSHRKAKGDCDDCKCDSPPGQCRDRLPTDDGGPKEIELLLDGERPKWSDALDMKDIGEVDDEENGEQSVSAGVRDEEKYAKYAEHVDGKYSEAALPVEVAVVGGVGAISNEQRSDEEAGENEEDVDAGSANSKRLRSSRMAGVQLPGGMVALQR